MFNQHYTHPDRLISQNLMIDFFDNSVFPLLKSSQLEDIQGHSGSDGNFGRGLPLSHKFLGKRQLRSETRNKIEKNIGRRNIYNRNPKICQKKMECFGRKVQNPVKSCESDLYQLKERNLPEKVFKSDFDHLKNNCDRKNLIFSKFSSGKQISRTNLINSNGKFFEFDSILKKEKIRNFVSSSQSNLSFHENEKLSGELKRIKNDESFQFSQSSNGSQSQKLLDSKRMFKIRENLRRPNPIHDNNFSAILQSPNSRSDLEGENSDLSVFFRQVIRIIFDMKETRRMKIQFSEQKQRLQALLSKISFQTNNIYKLEKLLEKFLLGKKLFPEDINLSRLELVIFGLFLVKKKYENVTEVEWNCKSLKKLYSQKIIKRKTQNVKAILKKFLNVVIPFHNVGNDLPRKHRKSFYLKYFAGAMEELDCDWEELSYKRIFSETKPTKRKKDEIRCNLKDFMYAVSRSNRLLEWLKDYMSNELELGTRVYGVNQEFCSLVSRKLPLLLFNWRRCINSERNIATGLVKLVEKIVRNDKVKLPWSLKEAGDGVKVVQKILKIRS